MPSSAHPADRFEAALDRAALQSERLRTLILAVMLGVLAVVLGAIWLALDDAFRTGPEQPPLSFFGPLFLSTAMVYELIRRRQLARLAARGGTRKPLFVFANAVAETCFPTVALAMFATFAPPAEALSAPPVFGYFFLIILTVLQLDGRLSIWVSVSSAVQYSGLVLWHGEAIAAHGDTLLGVQQVHHVRALLLLIAGVVAALVAREVRRQVAASITHMHDRERAVDLFGQHVSPQVARALLDGEPAHASREVVVLFLDIRGFTRFSSTRAPEAVMAYLDALLGPLMETVRAHRGVVDKLLGDGFMAVFGAPEPDPDAALHAVRAAREMLAQAEALVADGLPATRLGIGIHKGPAMAGLIGSGRRREYTVIGDTVNLAARVESACKPLNAALLITEAVWQALPAEAQRGEKLPPHPIRGRGEVALYRLVPAAEPAD